MEFEKTMESLEEIKVRFGSHLVCKNDPAHRLNPMQTDYMHKDSVFRKLCNTCGRQGKQMILGIFECSDCEDQKFRVCWQCVVQSFYPTEMPNKDKFDTFILLPFFEHPFTNYNFKRYTAKSKRWTCISVFLRNHP